MEPRRRRWTRSNASYTYIEDAVKTLLEVASELGIKSQVIKLKNSEDVRKMAPSAYGLFNVVYNGKLLSYHYLLKNDFQKRLEKLSVENS